MAITPCKVKWMKESVFLIKNVDSNIVYNIKKVGMLEKKNLDPPNTFPVF